MVTFSLLFIFQYATNINNVGLLLVNDVQTPLSSPPPLKKGQIGILVLKDAQCSETYAKSIFLFFCIFLLTKFPFLASKDFSTKI